MSQAPKCTLEEIKTYYEEPWAARIQNEMITDYDLQFASKHYSNVIYQWDMVLKVRKKND